MSEEGKLTNEERGIVQLWNSPGAWWRKRHWTAKILLVAFYSSLMAAISIVVYDLGFASRQQELYVMQQSRVEELSRLVVELKRSGETERTNANEEVLDELADLRDDLLRYQSSKSVLGESTIDTSLAQAIAALEAAYPGVGGSDGTGKLKLNDDKWDGIGVYASPLASSKIIGTVEYGVVYSYFEVNGDWYEIELPTTKDKAWIQGQFVLEL